MSYTETVLMFDCAGETLVGVVSQPAGNPVTPRTGVIIVVGGPQYRVGSHRQFVLLARALAASGMAVLRFDYRGMGDGGGAQRDFADVDEDIRAAIDALVRQLPSLERICLWGLCDGASAALLYVESQQDSRVTHLCLANPWVRSPETLARTHIKHYYTARLKQWEFWKKLLSGKVALRAVHDIAQSIRIASAARVSSRGARASFQQRMASGWQHFAGPIQLLLSSDDYVAKEFLEHTGQDADWTAVLARKTPYRSDLVGLDHTFSSASARQQVERLTAQWLAQTDH